MKEKTRKVLLIVLAVLLAVSLFFNGWLLHEHSLKNDTAPTNTFSDCIASTTSLEACKSCCDSRCADLGKQSCADTCKITCNYAFALKISSGMFN